MVTTPQAMSSEFSEEQGLVLWFDEADKGEAIINFMTIKVTSWSQLL